MSNENALAILEDAGLPANLEDLMSSLNENVLPDLPSAGGVPFLTLDQDSGKFVFGQDGEEIEPDSKWVLLVGSIRHGYFAWLDGEPHERMVSLNEKKIDKASLEDLGVNKTGFSAGKPATWAPAAEAHFKCITGEHRGTTVMFSGKNKGGAGMMKKLIEAIAGAASRPGGYIFPVVEFSSTDKVGNYKKRFPRAKIVDWLNAQGENRATASQAKATVEEQVQDVEVVETEAGPFEDDGAKAAPPAKSNKKSGGRRKLS